MSWSPPCNLRTKLFTSSSASCFFLVFLRRLLEAVVAWPSVFVSATSGFFVAATVAIAAGLLCLSSVALSSVSKSAFVSLEAYSVCAFSNSH